MGPAIATPHDQPRSFFGPTVVRAAFTLAVFGWGLGLYGPPIFLHAVVARTGWPLQQVALAVTAHFLLGAIAVANQPRLYRRFGIPATTMVGACSLVAGMLAWTLAAAQWQLFVAAALTGCGWTTMGGAAINTIVARWYVAGRPQALGTAYNGASVGGMVFSTLLVVLAARIGMVATAAVVGLVTLGVVALIVRRILPHTPASLGQSVDGVAAASPATVDAVPADGSVGAAHALRRDRQFLTLAAAMTLGLFAQVGMLAHLFGLLVEPLGAQGAGAAMTLASGCAIAGRVLVGAWMPADADRRRVAALSYATQMLASMLLMFFGTTDIALLLLAIVLFGLGLGNATSLPPLVAQVEFASATAPRVVANIVALSQGLYAFAPAAFALLLATAGSAPAASGGSTAFFAAVAVLQLLAATMMLLGRRRPGLAG